MAQPPITPGDEFVVQGRDGRLDSFRREADDPAPAFECERIRVTHLASTFDPRMRPYTFGTEPEWFRQRGLVAASTRVDARAITRGDDQAQAAR